MVGNACFDIAVVGGGFFGCSIAARMAARGASVVLIEAADRLLCRASYNNQARVHNGYHYPRSTLTALRSRVNFPRFVDDYRDCIVSDFEKYYAVGRQFSKVTARQFELFFNRIGAPLHRAPERVRRLFDHRHIEDVWSVVEFAFDADKLASRATQALEQSGVHVLMRTSAVRVSTRSSGGLHLDLLGPAGDDRLCANQVFNCTYSRLNHFLNASGLPLLPLKHELTEMALVKVPDSLQSLGITVMCGPFFSAMPFPPRGLHTLSHVRFTPHESWLDHPGAVRDPYQELRPDNLRSRFAHMVRDASRYVPDLAGCIRQDSLWEIKTVLTASEVDDSRPILLRRDWGLPGLHCVMGAKVDNIYDVIDEIELDSGLGQRRAG